MNQVIEATVDELNRVNDQLEALEAIELMNPQQELEWKHVQSRLKVLLILASTTRSVAMTLGFVCQDLTRSINDSNALLGREADEVD